MPTARELLDQADALMRRNRKRGKGRLGDVPTLTDALETSIAPTVVLPVVEGAADPIVLEPETEEPATDAAKAADEAEPMSLDTLGDLPVLTDAVLDWPTDDDASLQPGAVPKLREPIASEVAAVEETAERATRDAFPASAAEAQAAAAELPAPAVLEREAAPETEPSETPAESAGVEPMPTTPSARVPFLDDDFILEIPPRDENAPPIAPPIAASPPSPIDAAPLLAPEDRGVAETSPVAPENRDWDALAEEIRMQVLQRLDLFTDTRLREQLGARLAPIVERASAQLIETINRELGELVRSYVAEAIEREIDSWRKQQPKT
ncbi:MAG TPA: hypothetical protein VF304_04835 [Casimicrobiaceae bacterium]